MGHCRKFQRPLLGEDAALGGEVDAVGLSARLRLHRLIAAVDRICLHDHAAASAIGHIVHTAVLIQRIVPNVPALYGQCAVFPCPSQNALREHCLAHLRKQRCHINPHRTVPPADGSAWCRHPDRFPAQRPELPESGRSFRIRPAPRTHRWHPSGAHR